MSTAFAYLSCDREVNILEPRRSRHRISLIMRLVLSIMTGSDWSNPFKGIPPRRLRYRHRGFPPSPHTNGEAGVGSYPFQALIG